MRRFIVALVSLVAACAGLGYAASSVHAATPIFVTAGEGYYPSLDGHSIQGTCSFTAFGHYDGQRVALTAGHCGAPGTYAVTWTGQQVGRFIYTAISPDHGFIALNANVTTAQPFTSIGSPHVGEPVMKDGNGFLNWGVRSGFIYALGSDDDVCTTVPTFFGDSGGPLFDGTTLIGVGSRLANAPCGIFEFSRADLISGFTLG